MLQIYNTLTKKKQRFISEIPGEISIYVCGVTVYDYCHLGHARLGIFFDAMIRYLQFSGYKTTYIRNITDLDDKILYKAHQNNQPYQEITAKFIHAMHQDFAALNLLPPTAEPKATEFIDEMIQLISNLIIKGNAYVGNNGDVFFDIASFPSYGILAHCDAHNMQSTDRLEELVQAAKINPQDFVLWKSATNSEVGWDSPWGYGRPGWHTECAAMSLKLFGKTFDIHGGAIDLIFPHHENEIAQAEASCEQKFVNYWMHIGFLQFNHEKMSKSLGNFTLIKDILVQVHPEVLRYFMLSSHYRSQIDFLTDKISMAKQSLVTLYIALRGIANLSSSSEKMQQYINHQMYLKYANKFSAAMNDDFNTPLALSILFAVAKELNVAKEHMPPNVTSDTKKHILPKTTNNFNTTGQINTQAHATDVANTTTQIEVLAFTLQHLANSLGLLMDVPETFLQHATNNDNATATNDLTAQQIQALIDQRNAARIANNWELADLIRNQLHQQGIILEDCKQHTTWRRAINKKSD